MDSFAPAESMMRRLHVLSNITLLTLKQYLKKNIWIQLWWENVISDKVMFWKMFIFPLVLVNETSNCLFTSMVTSFLGDSLLRMEIKAPYWNYVRSLSFRVCKTWKTWKMGCFFKKVLENLKSKVRELTEIFYCLGKVRELFN